MELYMAVGGMPDYSGNCTPSYYNSEGNRGPKAARNLTYIGSLLDYDGFLQRWRADAAETGEYPAPARPDWSIRSTPSRPGACSLTSRARHHPSRVGRSDSVGRPGRRG